ncbi:MAG: uncharacterized protein KVP18_001869 [Porospora cf. gigantea A]|uniref:uncharacterized protein n=1 Tax=Porospora cf. gigantea A TaxID=2853593 RepID=UPI003559B8BD|nr:MAG: hypothetical protein KVP18_001869 [Porospora cf. gigantea A]
MRRDRELDTTPLIEIGDPCDTPIMGEAAEGSTPNPKRTKWEGDWDGQFTPAPGSQATPGETPYGMGGATPGTPYGFGMTGETPMMYASADTIVAGRGAGAKPWAKRLTLEDLDRILPKRGYEILEPPAGYETQRLMIRPELTRTPIGTAEDGTPFFDIPDAMNQGPRLPQEQEAALEQSLGDDLGEVSLKASDMHFFAALLKETVEDELTAEEQMRRKISILLLKVKNGSPAVRRLALKELTARATEFGAGPIFDQVLPLMMQSTLDDQERHLLVKVIDRIMYRLDDKLRPYVHKILVVIEPMLIDEDYFARVEGREIISNLSKAAGLATMIATMRPDIDHPDEYVRNTTARAFAVVASALGISSIILFLRAVCQSKKSWQARHTGIKIVHQTAVLMGSSTLPHLRPLVEIVAHGLTDENQKVRTITGLAISALAEAAAPYGIEAFDCVLRPLWQGIADHRGKSLAAYLKAIGCIIPLMDPKHSSYYTREVMVILIREFSTPYEEMKKVVLQVLKCCIVCNGLDAAYIDNEVLGPFVSNFWVVRNALDKRNLRLVVDCSLEMAKRVGVATVLNRVILHLKDPSEPYRRMTIETIELIITQLGVSDIDTRLEENLIDGMIYAFQEHSSDDATVLLNGFGVVCDCLGRRIKPYLPQIAGVIRWHLQTPSARVRMHAADLVQRVAVVMLKCGEEEMLAHLGMFLFEYLSEEYPEVLGSIIGGMKAIVNVLPVETIQPPIKDMLPRLTPILKNRHEKVQENIIDLVGRIADRAGDLVSPNEWDRICFNLLEMLKAHKKSIRRSTVNTFGYIARTIGPHDVIATLLSNLRVQERQLRVCTTIAIAIVAETCMPYTVLPALMNEYKTPDCNIQNGVLKATSFMFEYIGEMAKDYVYSITPLLEDALADRDMVHRQTAAWTCKHLALGIHGLGCKDALTHLMNFVWPNIFETSPHITQAVFDAVDGFRVALGPGVMLQYLLQGLFHPARRVREVYWRLYNNVYIGHQDSLVPYFPQLPLSATRKPPDNNTIARPLGSEEEDMDRGICELMMNL